jgi:hypothetical protein
MTNVCNIHVGHLDVICPAIALLKAKTSKITRQVIRGAEVEMPDWRAGVVSSIRHIPGVLVVVVVRLKLMVESVPAV